MTAPIWAAILGCIWIGEMVSNLEIIALVLSFSAIICIALSEYKEEEEETRSNQVDESTIIGSYLLGSALILGAAWSYATINVITRKM